MKKVNRYIRKINESLGTVTRYYPFNLVKNFVLTESNDKGEFIICPQCGELNYKQDWDGVDEKLPRCLYCRNLVMELEED